MFNVKEELVKELYYLRNELRIQDITSFLKILERQDGFLLPLGKDGSRLSIDEINDVILLMNCAEGDYSRLNNHLKDRVSEFRKAYPFVNA